MLFKYKLQDKEVFAKQMFSDTVKEISPSECHKRPAVLLVRKAVGPVHMQGEQLKHSKLLIIQFLKCAGSFEGK